MNNDPAHNLNHLRIQINIGGLDLAEWLERLAVNAKVAKSIPASSDTTESEGPQMKQCWITYIIEEEKEYLNTVRQGVTKRSRLSLLTNSALVYESQCGRMGGGVGRGDVAGSYLCTSHAWSPNKLRRSYSIFNLWNPHSNTKTTCSI